MIPAIVTRLQDSPDGCNLTVELLYEMPSDGGFKKTSFCGLNSKQAEKVMVRMRTNKLKGDAHAEEDRAAKAAENTT